MQKNTLLDLELKFQQEFKANVEKIKDLIMPIEYLNLVVSAGLNRLDAMLNIVAMIKKRYSLELDWLYSTLNPIK